MKLSIKIKLNPTTQQHSLLKKTMELFNNACNLTSQTAFHTRTFAKWPLQKLVYHQLRKSINIPAQLMIRAIAVVGSSYKVEKERMHWFKKTSAIPFDSRLRTFCGQDFVKLRLWNQRIKVSMTLGKYQLQKLNDIKLFETGESDLIYDRRTDRFYIVVTIDNPEHVIYKSKKVLGLDLGIKNIVADSTGTVWTGSKVQQTRKRYATLRIGLQSRGSKSSRRHLKKLSGKEQRFCRDVNHCISKLVVQKAKGTRSALALEEFKGIRNRLGLKNPSGSGKRVRKSVRTLINKWSFFQLRFFIAYKAKIAGVPVFIVPAYHSSQTCSVCGHVSKKNRTNRDDFRCVKCVHAECADLNASKVIAQRAPVNGPIASDCETDALSVSPTRARCKPTALVVGN